MRSLWPLIPLVTAATISAAHETDLDARIHDYILNNPEVILQALERLAAQEQKEALRQKLSSHSALFETPPTLGIGLKDAPIRVVEFFDYKCAPCKAIHPQLEAFVAAHPEVRIEMRHLPILTPGSERAARFALAVRDVAGEEAYAHVHHALWAFKGPLNSTTFALIAADAEVDFATVEASMYSEPISERITYNRDFAIEMGIAGTPAFVTPDSVTFGTTAMEELETLWLSQ